MTHDEMIAVIMAAKNDKPIQVRGRGKCDTPWKDCENPVWDFACCDYRVKPIYRPYANAEEFVKDMREHGPCVRDLSNAKRFECPLYINEEGVEYSGSHGTNDPYEYIFEHHCWQDGSPCGVEE